MKDLISSRACKIDFHTSSIYRQHSEACAVRKD